jgi:tetratricopeptide (TPR) repeat protein
MHAQAYPRFQVLWSVLALLVLVLVPGCSDKDGPVDEHNPLFRRGTQLRKEKQYAEAAEAFHQCLRLSPDSAGADLQLGTLYEDHLSDPFQAVHHYREYLR